MSNTTSSYVHWTYNQDNTKDRLFIKNYITEKIGKLEKYFGSDFDAVATLKIEGNNQVAEIRVNIASETFKAATASKDLYASVDKDIEILEGQIRKSKTKKDKQNMVETIRMNNSVNSENAEEDGEIIKTIYYSIKPLTAEDAKLVLEGDAKNKFLPFINVETNQVNVIYKLKDGKNFGILEPED